MPIEDWTMTTTPAGVPYIETTDPAGNPFGGSVAPEYAEDPEKMRQLIARLEARFAQYPAVAARQQQAGGGQYQLPENFGESLQGAFQSMPLREAERAVAAAIQFQGMRGYQQSLQAGESSDTALARWAPLMFYSHPAAISQTMRSMRAPTMTPYQQESLDLARQRLDLQRQKPPMTLYQEESLALRKQSQEMLKARMEEAATSRSQSQRNYLLRREAAAAEKALANARAMQADPNIDKASKPGDEAMRALEASYASAAGALTNAPAMTAPAAAPTPPSPAKEVIRRTKDGRLAVFDSDTKKFLRYAD